MSAHDSESASEPAGRGLALLALAASETGEKGPCPSNEQLATFADGALVGHDRNAMLGHLNRCPQCYHQWLEVSTYLTELEETETAVESTAGPSLWQRLSDWMTPWSVVIPAATAALAALVVLWPAGTDLGDRIDAGYAQLRVSAPEKLASMGRQLPVPGSGAALAFATTEPSLPARAFGAGLWAGRVALAGEVGQSLPGILDAPASTNWVGTEWASFYQFGRWSALLWVEAEAGEFDADWSEHEAIRSALVSELMERPPSEPEAQLAQDALRRLQAAMGDVHDAGDSGAVERLSRELLITINQLAP